MIQWSPWEPNNRIVDEQDAEDYFNEHAAHGAQGDWQYFECHRCNIRFKVEILDEPVGPNHRDLARRLFG